MERGHPLRGHTKRGGGEGGEGGGWIDVVVVARPEGVEVVAGGRTGPRTAITSAATAGTTTAVTATREGDGHCYLLDTEAGEEAMPQICASSPRVSPP